MRRSFLYYGTRRALPGMILVEQLRDGLLQFRQAQSGLGHSRILEDDRLDVPPRLGDLKRFLDIDVTKGESRFEH